jgi:proline utilization trans-activator
VEELLKENQRLKDQIASTQTQEATVEEPLKSTADIQTNIRNPLIEKPWFFPVSSLDMPIHIGEAACAAFATRFRQTLSDVSTAHIPRVDFITDDQLLVLSDADCAWPTPSKARFLVKAALDTVCSYYHIVRRSQVQEWLETSIRDPEKCSRLQVCTLLSLFAVGEIYSRKVASTGESFPGLIYFARARKLVSVPAERPGISTIEITLLLVSLQETLAVW